MHPSGKGPRFTPPRDPLQGPTWLSTEMEKLLPPSPRGECCKQLREPVPRNQTAVAFVPLKPRREVSVSSSCRLVHIWCSVCFLPPPEALIAGPRRGAVRTRVRGSLPGAQRAGATAASPAARSTEDAASRSGSSPPGAWRPPSVRAETGKQSSDTAGPEAAPRPLP